MLELYLLRVTILILLIVILVKWRKRQRSKGESDSEVMNLVIHSETSERVPTDTAKEQEPDSDWLANLRETISENLVSPHFNVDHLAELMGISRTALYRLAQEKVNQTPNQLIQELRLLQARSEERRVG